MILSSTTRFIIQASNIGRYAKLMGNGRSYRLPGRNIVTTDLRRGNPQASEAATLAIRRAAPSPAPRNNANPLMSKPALRAVQSEAHDKANEFADADKTTSADWASTRRAAHQYKR